MAYGYPHTTGHSQHCGGSDRRGLVSLGSILFDLTHSRSFPTSRTLDKRKQIGCRFSALDFSVAFGSLVCIPLPLPGPIFQKEVIVPVCVSVFPCHGSMKA